MDYDKLASQFGGSAADPVDKYDELARTLGGKAGEARIATPDQIPLSPGAAQRMAAEPKRKPQAPDSMLDKAFGALELPLTMASGTLGGLVGSVAGVGKSITGGKYGTQEGVREGEQFGGRIAEAMTYQPRTQTGGAIAQKLGEVMRDSGIGGIPIPELQALGRTTSAGLSVTRSLATPSAQLMAQKDAAMLAGPRQSVRELVGRPAQQMAGVGAASTDETLMRVQRAADLPVPIRLTKGQAERSFERQRFERETAKLPDEGAPLRERFLDQNDRVLKNLDAFGESTGAQLGDTRAIGKNVVSVIEGKKAARKAAVNDLYAEARAAGHMAEPIDVTPILKYLDANKPAALNAPILTSIKSSIKKLDPDGTGRIPLNDVEELRKLTGRLSSPGTPNAHFGEDIKGLIESVSRDKGGPLYQQARRGYENYSKEFRDRAAIDKLVRFKPGTKDRAVAFEDVFDHSILKGSRDDLSAIRRTLQTAGPDGEQAWRELQGQTINHIKETISGNVVRDANGNPIVSPAKLDKLVASLDEDGKLEFIFGKKGAQQIRDVNDLAKDIYVTVPDAANHSNTASVLIGLLDTGVSGLSGLPLPIGTTVNYGVKKIKSRAMRRKVEDALLPYPTRGGS